MTMNTNEVKKELYRSKAMARFSHYTSGNLYYTVEMSGGTYQFPIATIEQVKVLEDSTVLPFIKLSSDLGTTSFCAEVKGSDLNRWIAKAVEKGDFVKVS